MNIDPKIQVCIGVGVLMCVLVFGVLVIDEIYSENERECTACLERNEIPCEYGNCWEYRQDVDDCCPMCWASQERTVEV